MATANLSTPSGIRSAVDALAAQGWGERNEWVSRLTATIQRVRAADEAERSTEDFQQWLWERNDVAAVGQGQIPVDAAIGDAGFRAWLATRSMQPLPPEPAPRLEFLTELYEQMRDRLRPFLRDNRIPHLKIFRVIAALYPEAMTTIANGGNLDDLARAMGAQRRLDRVERHLWVRHALDEALGAVGDKPVALAERISLPWMLFERFVKASEEVPAPSLTPLPALRRRRGLTAIKGLFPGVITALEFAREGVTRDELAEFLRQGAPKLQLNSRLVMINVLKSEFDVLHTIGDRLVPTKRGEAVLESEDARPLADWLLTRILGFDKALVELRERGPLPGPELTSSIQSMNPGWTTKFAPNAMVAWLRSLGLIKVTPDWRYVLTDRGTEWASLVHWTPEALPVESSDAPLPAAPPVAATQLSLPQLTDIVTAVQKAGHFPGGLVSRLHSGLWGHRRRHFAILTGLSGAGKTLLAHEYGKALTSGANASRVRVIPVQPGWYDPGALLGYANPLRGESYSSTPFVEFLLEAVDNPSQPYVAIFDEMNLSHPEQYMAPLLSAMETGGDIDLHSDGESIDGVPHAVRYPENLALIGTVNMDETTHGLSDKVLDRAFVLDFWHVDLDAYPKWGSRSLDEGLENLARGVLVALMAALSPARLHFGWRTVDDVLDFLQHSKQAGGPFNVTEALDAVVYAKVLPKLRGEDSPRFRGALAACEHVLEEFELKQCRAKLVDLRRDLEATGSARFWR